MNKNMVDFFGKLREQFSIKRGTDIHRQLQFLRLEDIMKFQKK